jgi:hypothetical protein
MESTLGCATSNVSQFVSRQRHSKSRARRTYVC